MASKSVDQIKSYKSKSVEWPSLYTPLVIMAKFM
jgi:hypothetical protein